MKAEMGRSEFRGAHASRVLAVASRRGELPDAHASGKIHGFLAADVGGSSRSRDDFANTRDACAPRSSQPHAP